MLDKRIFLSSNAPSQDNPCVKGSQRDRDEEPPNGQVQFNMPV
jgi:hypothetical protein